MNTNTRYKIITSDDYDTSVNNNKLNNTFPVSALGLDPPLSPGVQELQEGENTRDVRNSINIEDLDIEEVYDPIYNITTTKHERKVFNIMLASAEENLPEAEIEGIEFSIIKKETLRNYSIAINSDEKMGPGSINDARLGVVKGNDRCGTCHRTVEHCPGHLGRIELFRQIVNPFYRREVIRCLNIFCNVCGASLLTKNQIEDLERITHAKSRLHLIEEHVKNKKNFQHTHRRGVRTDCVEGVELGPLLSCVPNPTYILDKGGYKIEYTIEGDIVKLTKEEEEKIAAKKLSETEITGEEEEKVGKKKPALRHHERTIEDIIKIFNLISIEDAKMVGLGNNMPIDFIMFYIPVPPPKLRGASHKEVKNESDRMADSLLSIIKADKNIRSNELDQKKLDVQQRYIYESVKTLIESKEPKSYRGTSQISMRMLIQGKEGLFRQFMMSKRADFTARSVIGPDPDIDFGEVSVPREWANKLTVSELVFQANRSYMNKLLQKGHITNVTKGSGHFKGQLLRVRERNRDNIQLEIGDLVSRWLQDGDWVTVNRMPSLHKQSTMAMKVRLWSQQNIGLHLSYTTPFNADFDGDEMNLHSFQIVEAISQAAGIMNVEACIPNEQNNSPIMGLVMDNVVGSYLLTYMDDIIDVDTWNDCLVRINTKDDLATLDERLIEQGVKKYTGKALFSALLPAGLYYDNKGILIVDGILVNGVITKDHIGPTSGSIIQAIYNNPDIMIRRSDLNIDTLPGLSRGLRRASLFIRNAYHVLNRWLTEYGFTLGLSDCRIEDSKLLEIKKAELSKLRMVVNELGAGTFTTNRERRQAEAEIMVAINNFASITGKALTEIVSKENNFYILIASKTKGNYINLSQMALAVGQQTYFGERMKMAITNGTRVLPHFDVGEDDLASKGFIENNYIEGITPIEYFFQGAGARQGLLISAMSISDIGKIRRDIFKMVEDLKVLVDGSVRDSNSKIVQEIYGSDGKSGSKLFRNLDNKGYGPSHEDFLLVATDHNTLANQLNVKHGYQSETSLKIRSELEKSLLPN